MDEVNKLLNSLIFVEDRELLIKEIEVVKRSIFSVGSSEELEKSLKDNLAGQRAEAFFEHLNKSKKNVYDGHIIEEILESLRKMALELDTITVYVPIELSKAELSDVHKKLTKVMDKQILLKAEKRRELLGGIKIEYKGVYLDLSLATTIKNMTIQA